MGGKWPAAREEVLSYYGFSLVLLHPSSAVRRSSFDIHHSPFIIHHFLSEVTRGIIACARS
jgi:hypothetical protein